MREWLDWCPVAGQSQPTKRICQGLLKNADHMQYSAQKVSTDCRFPASGKVRRINILKIQSNLCFSGSSPLSVSSKLLSCE